MTSLTLLLAISCLNPQIVNKTKEWNDYDQQTYIKAISRCKEIWPDAPCLKVFTKKDATTYTAICGNYKKGG